MLSPPVAGEMKASAKPLDLNEVKGQEVPKRALEIAAAGGHNLLFVGPPGSGKSMLAQRLPGILPPLTSRELLETSQVWSMAGLIAKGELTRERPFRAPHHSASMAALTGGGIRFAGFTQRQVSLLYGSEKSKQAETANSKLEYAQYARYSSPQNHVFLRIKVFIGLCLLVSGIYYIGRAFNCDLGTQFETGLKYLSLGLALGVLSAFTIAFSLYG
ncbi:hypothetical protein ABENE_22575 [Asticcacaulis benevestitus DSM 16100 = ATCC BAA-896]|uniref:Magnesium chelatase ChlI-like catalytic domain-containing protein n=1 Tax=Asticcacaulis benevestitus DSM 16100 = ATCC BAA-896 TaxID=1121022 RepID=V4NVR0_9CAUL|nr:hypothetical protein ABENE_22575 [Asticcacaulis benevestitus DSM 16100 = ATCC BAA-896]